MSDLWQTFHINLKAITFQLDIEIADGEQLSFNEWDNTTQL